jgi:hypothetical protein
MLRNVVVTYCICSLLITGCATAPQTTPLRPLAHGSQISVVVNLPGIVPPDAKDTSEAISEGASSYAASGFAEGASGMVEASVACGPLMFFCMPLLMIAGGTVGAVFGAVAGGISGANIALPDDKAAILEKLIKSYLDSEDISANLLNKFNQKQNGRWQVVDSDTGIIVTLGVENIIFSQFSDDELAIRLTSNLVVRYGPEATNVTKRILLNAESGRYHVDHWIANEGANLKAGLDAVFEENSRQVIAVLSQVVNKKHPKSGFLFWDQ